MPPEILALVDKPHLLLAVLLVGGLIGMLVEQVVSRQRRAAWKARFSRPLRGTHPAPPLARVGGSARSGLEDAAAQLSTVMRSGFRPRPLLNRRETRLLVALEQIVAQLSPGWRVMAQVSLGEILASADEAAYRCINSKRVDLLLVDRNCRPLHAIEYQGEGHHRGTAAARDAVKKEALRRAGIGYVEIVPGDRPTELRRLVEKLVASDGGAILPARRMVG